MLETLTLIAYVAVAAVNWVAVSAEARETEYITKPAALALLLLYAVQGDNASGWLVAALVFSLLGDVYLMLPIDAFTAGLGAFLLGHVAYIGDIEASTGARLVWLVIVLAASAPVSLRIVRAVENGVLRSAVVVYIVAIATMVASALASGSFAAIVGGILFMASDSMIAWNRFVRPFDWARPAIMVTYHLGQLGLVVALR